MLLSLAAMTRANAQRSGNLEQDLERVRGTFSLASGTADGAAMPGPMASSMKRVSDGFVTTVTMGTMLYMKASFSIDPNKSPKTIDYEMTGGFSAGKKQLGIYKISGDTVTFCFGSPDKPRPLEFESKSGSGVTCTAWQREKN